MPQEVMRLERAFSSRPQVLDEVVQLIFGQVVGTAVFVFGIEDGPDFFEGAGGAVMKVWRSEGDVDQLRRVEKAPIVSGLFSADVEGFLAGAFGAAVTKRASVRL